MTVNLTQPKSPSDILSSGELKPIFIILVDISGYTRFINYHKISLLHAEKIIAELMESILREVEVPVMAHEILGDAISLYAIDEGTTGQADKIYGQLQNYFNAFRDREASLISSCKLCRCDACKQVGKLRMKAVLHHGTVAFTRVHNIQKISGEDVILSHRLLKNSLQSKEYILMTSAFYSRCEHLDSGTLIRHQEAYHEIGNVNLWVNVMDDVEPPAAKLSLAKKLIEFFDLEWYSIKNIFRGVKMKYRNLPE